MNNITTAWDVWENVPWSERYSKEIFINFIIPPRIADEPTEYYWRTDIPQKLDFSYGDEEMSILAQRINSEISVDTKSEEWGNSQMGYTATMAGNFGKCDDRAILATMAMRSYGIPSAFDFTPMWGSGNNGHSFCSVLTTDGKTLVFQDRKDNGNEHRFSHKVAKIYRKTFFENTETLVFQNRENESIPFPFSDHRIKDVTHEHQIGFEDIQIAIDTTTNHSIGYLGVFHPGGWFPIAFGEINGKILSFHSIGNGLDNKGKIALKGDNIGKGILYLPFIYHDKIIPCGNPFILSDSGTRQLIPSEETERVLLLRKYPRLLRIARFAGYMTGGILEGANHEDFSDAIQIHRIYNMPLSHMQEINAKGYPPLRYIRFRQPSGTFSIATLKAFDDFGREIKGTPITSESLNSADGLEFIYDDDPLTYFELSPVLNVWTGLDFDTPRRIASIGFCPRNDDNDIVPEDLYELFYWDNGWESLGKKRAKGYNIEFDNVPKGALLWLRDITKGKEERPFTYENGKQIWW